MDTSQQPVQQGAATNRDQAADVPTAPPQLGDLIALLERRYPPQTAEPWDAVGLVAGDPEAPVRKVLFAVDPVGEVVDEALEWGADLLITHHPLFLKPVHAVAATTYKGLLVHRLVRGDCALYAAHTNADAARDGVADALAQALGLIDTRPLVAAAESPLDKFVVFVPQPHTDAVTVALAAAGAGEAGDYAQCSWLSSGTGRFTPQAGARPAVGRVGEPTSVAEDRLEMVAPRRRRAQIVAALRAAHPYEEPAFDVLELASSPGSTGLGRVGRVPETTTLGEFAQVVARTLPRTAQGVRVAGDLTASIETVAVLGGSGDSLFDDVRASGADVYVTSDLRHHPASELRERAVFEQGRPYLIDTAHFASEWPWLALAARDLDADLSAGDSSAAVEIRVSDRCTDPWTARFDS